MAIFLLAAFQQAFAQTPWIAIDQSTAKPPQIWEWTSRTQPEAFTGIALLSRTAAVAIGTQGKVALSEDSGSHWSSLPTGVVRTLNTIATDGHNFVIAGDHGTILRGSDLGLPKVVLIATPVTSDLSGILLLRDREIVVGEKGVVLLSTDFGEHWSIRQSNTTENLKWIITPDEGKTLIVGGNRGTMLRSIDSGEHWNPLEGKTNSDLETAVSLRDGFTMVAAGAGGTILCSQDAGETWTQAVTEANLNIVSLVALGDTKTLVAAGESLTRSVVIMGHYQPEPVPLLRSVDGGRHWSIPDMHAEHYEEMTSDPSLSSVIVTGDETSLLGVSEYGAITRSTDAGAHWSYTRRKPFPSLKKAVVFENGQIIIAVGSGSRMYRSLDVGNTWEMSDRYGNWGAVPDSFEDPVGATLDSAIALNDGKLLVAVGYPSRIVRSDDAGHNWRIVQSDKHGVGLTKIVSLNKGRALLAVGYMATILRSTDLGDHWVSANKPRADDYFLNDAVSPDDRTLIAVGGRGFAGESGVIVRSEDAGENWVAVGPIGSSDLVRVVSVPSSRAVVAVGHSGTILRSTDGGEHWSLIEKKTSADLEDIIQISGTTTLIAVGKSGTILRSTDAGSQWTLLPALLSRNLHHIAELQSNKTLVIVGDRGTALRSDDSGEHWTLAKTPDENSLINVVAREDGTLIASGLVPHGMRMTDPPDGELLNSSDDGRNWVTDIRHDFGGHTDILSTNGAASDSFAFGEKIEFRNPQPIATAQFSDRQRLSISGEKLTMEWSYSGSLAPMCTQVLYEIEGSRVANELVSGSIDAPRREGDATVYSISWNPSDVHLGAGVFRYGVNCTDPITNISWIQRLPGTQQWNSFWGYFVSWLNNFDSWTETSKGVAAVTMLIVFWLIGLFGLYVFAPTLLITIRCRLDRSLPEDAAKGIDKLMFGAFGVLRWLGVQLLFGFASNDRPLGLWVQARASTAIANFAAQRVVQDRRITVEIPVRLGKNGPTLPTRNLEELVQQSSLKLLICGPGGAGKTTLACQLALRASNGKRTIPLLIETDFPPDYKADEFVTRIAGILRSSIDEKEQIANWLVEKLLRSGKILIVVDGLSERSADTARAFDPRRPNFPVGRLIATSRNRTEPGMLLTLEPIGISGGTGALVDFVTKFLVKTAELEQNIHVPNAPAILESCAKLLRLLRGTTATPLLASIWARQLARSDDTVDNNNKEYVSVADLLDSYVLLLLRTAAGGSQTFLQELLADVIAIARRELELNQMYRPGFITRGAALAAISARSGADVDRRMQLLEMSRLVEAASADRDAIRIEPDTVAEHLVARECVETIGNNDERWDQFIESLTRAGWPMGFIGALSSCSQNQSYGRLMPERIRILLEIETQADFVLGKVSEGGIGIEQLQDEMRSRGFDFSVRVIRGFAERHGIGIKSGRLANKPGSSANRFVARESVDPDR